MSTQSGITVSPELNDAFKSLSSSSALIIKISSDSTQLIPEKTIISTSFKSLFTELYDYISSQFPEPCYIIVSNEEEENDKTFISFIPDVAQLRSKMLYASTRNTIITNLSNGINNLKLAFTELDELKYDEFIKTINNNNNNNNDNLGLLTEDEKILQGINNNSSLSNFEFKKKLVSMGSNNNEGGTDILYKFEDELKNEINQLSIEDFEKLIVFNIDLSKELVILKSIKSKISINQLISTLESLNNTPKTPQYSIYNYSKSGKLAFIYSCPSGSPVKDRMIYASFKNSLINYLKEIFNKSGLIIDKNLEVGDLDELELSELTSTEQGNGGGDNDSESINSASSSSNNRLKFNKPKGPRRR